MNGDGMPQWAKIITQVGFPIVLSVWLLWRADGIITRTEAAIIQHQREASLTMTSQVALLRAICRSSAKSDRQIEFCDSVP